MRTLLVLLLLHVGRAAIAQELLRGRVVDAGDGSPLPYATVLVHSTDRGTITNGEGEFAVPALSEDDALRISFVGYRARLVTAAMLAADPLVRLERASFTLSEVTVRPGRAQYDRVMAAVRWLNRAPSVTSRLFFGMETYADTLPMEVLHAFFNTRMRSGRIDGLELKQGRIGITERDGRFYINYNTSRAFALMDILDRRSPFPLSPLAMGGAQEMRREFVAELVSTGSAPDGVDHLRVTPRKGHGEAFTLELWMEPGSDRVRSLQLSCTDCRRHPFLPLFDHGRIDTVDLRYRQTWSTTGPPLPEVMELDYRMVYAGPDFMQGFRTHAVMHAYDRSVPFILPLFTYTSEIPDYRKIGWLPEDSLFWVRQRPPLPTERQQRDMDFLRRNDLRRGGWYQRLSNERNFLTANYALWDAERRLWLQAMTSGDPRETSSRVTEGRSSDHAYSMEGPKVALVTQLYLDMDSMDGMFTHRTATVLDGYRSYYLEPEHPWTACFQNIWFDLCELERRRLEDRLRMPGMTVERARVLHSEHSTRLASTTEEYLRTTKYGADKEALLPWNDQVRQGLGIDNLALFGL